MKIRAAFVIILLQIFSYQTARAEMFYVSASAGQTTYDTGLTNLTGTATLDDETTSSKVLVGMNMGFGLMAEAYYTDLGEVTFTANNGDTVTSAGTVTTIGFDGYKSVSEFTGYGINAVYKVGIGIASVYGKVGMLHWESETTVGATGFADTTTTDSGNELLVGAGVEFAVMPFIGLRLDYEQTEIDDDDVTTIAAGIVVGF